MTEQTPAYTNTDEVAGLESDTCELCGYVVTEATPRGSLMLGGKIVCTTCYADPTARQGSK